jgi:hypothetical protein
MFAGVLTAVLAAALAAGQVQIGTIRAVTIESNDNGRVTFRVTGTNPCGAVHIDYGDGEAITTPIVELPATITHRYARSGEYAIAARGMGNCEGRTTLGVRTVVAQPAQADPPAPQGRGLGRGRGRQPDNSFRFPEMDSNDDRVITRDEWRGSAESFRVHDWNRDGVLSGAEVRVGQSRPEEATTDEGRGGVVPSWSRAVFQRLDRDGNTRITYDEWPYDIEGFRRADVNDDRVLQLGEFLASDIDDDRDDRFEYLDLNNDGFVSRTEWHGSRLAFDRIDRNRDDRLSRPEVTGDVEPARAAPAGSAAPPLGPGSAWRVAVPANIPWTDTGLIVRAGDELVINSQGEVNVGRFVGAAGAGPGSVPLPNELRGALIGRVERGAPFAAGPGNSIRISQTGRLYLGVNDDSFADNRGQFDVTIRSGR